jgi:hypothetical protein
MSKHRASDLTIVGGRPEDGEQGASAISPGLKSLLKRLAEEPALAYDLVSDPLAAVTAEGLTLTEAELTMLRHLDVTDLSQTRAMAPRPSRGAASDEASQEDEEEARGRLAAQLALVAPAVGDPDFYMSERTRGIRPQSIYPTPFAVAEALLRTSEQFRQAFLDDPREAVLRWPDLPLSDEERRVLLTESVRHRLEQVALHV